jgi:hypothetical protein
MGAEIEVGPISQKAEETDFENPQHLLPWLQPVHHGQTHLKKVKDLFVGLSFPHHTIDQLGKITAIAHLDNILAQIAEEIDHITLVDSCERPILLLKKKDPHMAKQIETVPKSPSAPSRSLGDSLHLSVFQGKKRNNPVRLAVVG